MIDPADDRRQRPGDADPANWVDVFELDFFSADGRFGGYVMNGVARHGPGWYWAAVVQVGEPVVLVVDNELPRPPDHKLELRATGMWIDLIPQIPLEHFTIGLEAFGVAIEDPSEVFNGLRGDVTPVGFDMEWETEGGAWPLVPDGFELPCRVHGEVLLGAAEIDFDGLGARRRWWGADDRRVEPGMWLSGWWDDGEPLVGCGVELLDRPNAATFDLDAAGRSMRASVQSVAPVPLVATGGRTAQRWRMLVRVAEGDRRGTGWLDLR